MEREEYGHRYCMITDRILPGWKSEGEGNPVVVTPPNADFPYWIVWVPHLERNYPICGDDAEERAFSVATGFIEQQ